MVIVSPITNECYILTRWLRQCSSCWAMRRNSNVESNIDIGSSIAGKLYDDKILLSDSCTPTRWTFDDFPPYRFVGIASAKPTQGDVWVTVECWFIRLVVIRYRYNKMLYETLNQRALTCSFIIRKRIPF